MKKLTHILMILIIPVVIAAGTARAELYIDGFLQGLYGGNLNEEIPSEAEYTAAESRMQLRFEDIGDRAEFFSRADFLYDGAFAEDYDWELREAYLRFRLGSNFDFKVGRQILTWGTGDLIFINDVFAKDYQSFFIGRDDQYLKAPQDALRMEYYNSLGNFSVVISPRFEANRLPTGRRLSYYNPMAGSIVGTGLDEMYYFDPPEPDNDFDNTEIALRFQRRVGMFKAALYFYKGFYKNPVGLDVSGMMPMPYYPKLNLYGASLRGAIMGGILWLEGGFYDSREDTDGENPYVPNRAVKGLAGFERQVATDLTANIQWQVDYMIDYDTFEQQMMMDTTGAFIRDEMRHLLTSRVTKKLNSETVILSGFVFYSPSDEDIYFRFSTEYKYTDELTLTFGGNIFDGNYPNTEFGQFALNDNVYLKLTYGF